jgi:hypothetical protein
MVGMLMGDQNGIEVLGLFADGIEAGDDVTLAEAGIDQDARPLGAKECGVSRTTASEHTDFDDDAPPVP